MIRKVHRSFAILAAAIYLSAVLATAHANAQTQTFYLDPNHSAAQFSVRHMGISTVRGTFTKMGGVMVDSTDLSKASVKVTIEAASVDTRVAMRDDDLKSDHYFDVQKFPTISFQSTKVELAGAGKLKVTGDLTLHGVTKTVVLDVDGPTAPVKDPRGTAHRGVSATTKLNRSEYGMTNGLAMVGDEIDIQLDVELVDKAPGGPPPPK